MFGGPTLYVFFSVNLDEFDHDLTWSRHWNDGEGKGDHFQVAASFSYVQVSELYIYTYVYIQYILWFSNSAGSMVKIIELWSFFFFPPSTLVVKHLGMSYDRRSSRNVELVHGRYLELVRNQHKTRGLFLVILDYTKWLQVSSFKTSTLVKITKH